MCVGVCVREGERERSCMCVCVCVCVMSESDDDGCIDVEVVGCSKCLGGEATEENDIYLCDHQVCMCVSVCICVRLCVDQSKRERVCMCVLVRGDDDGCIDVEVVGCLKCLGGEATEENDIYLCDHQVCMCVRV